MDRRTFDDYIARFNAQESAAFDQYIHPSLYMQNGGLVIRGVTGMKEHYARIWRVFRETLDVQRFVADADTIAIEMKAHFDAVVDAEDSPFGSVRVGEAFDYHGVIMYRLRDGQFGDIRVAYLSFSRTGLDGALHELGLAH